MTDWSQLDPQEFADVIATVESCAQKKGVDPNWLWRQLHKKFSSTPELAYLPEDEITSRVIVLVRRTYERWPETQQLREAALSRVSAEHRLSRSSLAVQGVQADGNGGHTVDLLGSQNRFLVFFESGPQYLSLVSVSRLPLPAG